LATPRTETTDCPLCGGRDNQEYVVARDRLHGIPGTYRYVRCGCGLVFQNPRVVTEDLPLLYPAAEYAPHQVADDQASAAFGRRMGELPLVGPFVRETLSIISIGDRVAARLPTGARWLDVGCGNGSYLAQLRDRYRVHVSGVDFAPAAVAAARGLNLDVHEGTIHTMPDSSFDVISMWWMLEHISDPQGEIERVAELLKPGGTLLVSVPNIASVSARMFGPRWYHLDPPRHLTLWTPATLHRLLVAHRLERIRVAHDRAPWGVMGMLRSSSPVLKAVVLPLTLASAALRLAETIAVEYRAT
jgi:2-polyprenyl-3-methyl-5-hydroxy-6-metoxy-1,4-benzoquinol methylase